MTIIKIEGKHITFSTLIDNFKRFVPLKNMRLSISGILKEHPDLEGLSDGEIREEAILRFQTHINSMDNEIKIKDYIITELEKFGWDVIGLRREGFREIKLK